MDGVRSRQHAQHPHPSDVVAEPVLLPNALFACFHMHPACRDFDSRGTGGAVKPADCNAERATQLCKLARPMTSPLPNGRTNQPRQVLLRPHSAETAETLITLNPALAAPSTGQPGRSSH